MHLLGGKPMIELHGWNDVSKTEIPLNQEIFALLEDRQNPEKLRPAVITARMRPAKSLTWTESKEGDVLCYDVPAGNFHSCNGAQIKYWKSVDIPQKFDSAVCGVVEAPKDCFDAELAIPPKPKPKSNPVAPEVCWKLISHCFAPDEYQVQWKCECGTVNEFKKSVPTLCNFPAFSVYCSHCNKKLNVTFDLPKMTK